MGGLSALFLRGALRGDSPLHQGELQGKGERGERPKTGVALAGRVSFGGRCGGCPPAQGRAEGPTAQMGVSPWRRRVFADDSPEPPLAAKGAQRSGPEPPEGAQARLSGPEPPEKPGRLKASGERSEKHLRSPYSGARIDYG